MANSLYNATTAERNEAVKNSEEFKKIFENTKPMIVAYGGSYAYGLQLPDSDVDIRGIAYNSPEEILGMKPDFEQYRDGTSDVCIYSFHKMMRLLTQCNPNTIEILGLRPTELLYCDEMGKLIIDNKNLFLSKKAIGTFGNYAEAQLNRLINKSGRTKKEVAENEARSIAKASAHISKRYGIELVDSVDKNGEVLINFKTGHHIPIGDFCSAVSEIMQINNDYKDIHRNTAAIKHEKLAKHMCHLVRLYLMAENILLDHEIITYREKNHDLLMDIKKGKYLMEDQKTPTPEFMELVSDLKRQFAEWSSKTTLPDEPDKEAINKLAMQINLDYIRRPEKNKIIQSIKTMIGELER